jgi:hypothetical protein
LTYGSLQIFKGSLDGLNGVAEIPESEIATMAQPTAKCTRFMTMIQHKSAESGEVSTALAELGRRIGGYWLP